MKQRLNASEDNLNIQTQTLYCIQESHKHQQSVKKEKNLNKLCLEYLLPKTNQERLFSNLVPFSARQYPESFNTGQKFIKTQYSSVRVRKHKKLFSLSKRYEEDPENKEQIKRYAKMLFKRRQKQQQGGIDSFWTFKKQLKNQEKKVKVGTQHEINQLQQPTNKLQNAFKRILAWCKQSSDSLLPKNLFKNYLALKFGQNFAVWFLNFYQFRSLITFKEFQQVGQHFKNIKWRQAHVVSFFLYDDNADSFICPRDIFGVFEKQLSPRIEKDVLKIAEYVKKNRGKREMNNPQFKIEHVVIRDDWLTIKDYQIYFKKVDQPYIRATNKKDTVFSKTFAVLDHRQKIRSVRKQMNKKKTMYDQLYGQITKERKNHAFIEENDYRLNFSILHEIFEKEQTELFKYFCEYVFNI